MIQVLEHTVDVDNANDIERVAGGRRRQHPVLARGRSSLSHEAYATLLITGDQTVNSRRANPHGWDERTTGGA